MIAQNRYHQETIAFIDRKSGMVHSVIDWHEKGSAIGHVNDERTMMALLDKRIKDDERRKGER